MKNIRTRLVSVFIVVIAFMVAVNAVFLVLHFSIVRKYEKITKNMFLEYRVIETVDKLTQTHYQLVKSMSKELLQEYNQQRAEIGSLFFYLDKTITYGESKIMYRGMKNVIHNIIDDCDVSLANALKGNVFESLQIYAEVSRKNYYVKDNFANLILKELEYTNVLQSSFQKVHFLVLTSSVILLVLVAAGCIAYAFIFSRKFTEPLERLSNVARNITKGDLSVKVDERLLKEEDEIGILAGSFNSMVVSLEETITQLTASHVRLEQTQAQLVQSAKMASVGLLAGGVAHEINNPLTGVLNNVQLIKMMAEQKQDSRMADFKDLLSVIEESALRCKMITQSLLDFSHASKGLFQPVSLNEVVGKVAVLIERELGLQNIFIRKDLQSDLPQILADSQLLQQVIFDLITNAKWAIRKKSEKEEGSINLKTEYRPRDRIVCFHISDNGIGITKENQEKIFEPFFTTKPVGEGTGLGLSIVYSIIKTHHGAIEVESEPGKGTTFTISFPAVAAPPV
jgi:signal transduction histidine kinase